MHGVYNSARPLYYVYHGTAAPARLFIATCTIIYRNKRLYTSVSGF